MERAQPWEEQGYTLDAAWEIFEFPPGLDPGGMRRRVAARVVDVLIASPLLAAVLWILIAAETGFTRTATAIVALTVLVWWGLYEVLMTWRYGATLGKRWLGIAVVRMADLAPPTFGQSLVRWASVATGAGPPRSAGMGRRMFSMFDLFSASHDPDGRQRGWPDKRADTVVIRARP